jgi:hypothetical protein
VVSREGLANEPLPYDMTTGNRKFGDSLSADEVLRKWDLSYKLRARKNGAFLACEAEFIELNKPPIISEAAMLQIFGRTPPTLTPPAISEGEYADLRRLTLGS